MASRQLIRSSLVRAVKNERVFCSWNRNYYRNKKISNIHSTRSPIATSGLNDREEGKKRERQNMTYMFQYNGGNIVNCRSSLGILSERMQGFNRQNQIREVSSIADIIPSVPWGATAHILNTLHPLGIPYWACMSLTNIGVRTLLLPVVYAGAKTAVESSKAAPEIQFIFSSFIRDADTLKKANASPSARLTLLTATFQSMKAAWKIYKVNPLDTFKSPLLQIIPLMYFSVDVRKLINGGDPELAQALTESGLLWVSDLTEPDPWYGLPIMTGALLYLQVELAMGKRSLAGETAAKSNLARIMKDAFQSLAIFMPCLMSQSPSGVQVYLLTSMVWTLFQSSALRNDDFRKKIGLPLKNVDQEDKTAPLVEESIYRFKLQRETHGVLSPKFYYQFRPYGQILSKDDLKRMEEEKKEVEEKKKKFKGGLGVYAPPFQPDYYQQSPISLVVLSIEESMKQLEEQQKRESELKAGTRVSNKEVVEIGPSPDEIMEAANKGERIETKKVIMADKKEPEQSTLNTKKISLKRKTKGKLGKRRR